MRRTVAVLLIIVLVLGFIRACVPSEHDREMKAWKEHVGNDLSRRGSDQFEGAISVDPSIPLELVVPSMQLNAKFGDENCRLEENGLYPTDEDGACSYTVHDRPYQLPGTTSSDIAVIAIRSGLDGATGGRGGGLHDHMMTPGEALYLKTEKSGELWLEYQATDVHEPEGPGLPESEAIWGKGPMPGRVVTVICESPESGHRDSSTCQLTGWQLQGVVEDANFSAG